MDRERSPIATRIVTFDMRGYGRSMIPPADFRWSLELFIADVFAVADAVGTRAVSISSAN